MAAASRPLVLALDTASPVVSVALAGRPLAGAPARVLAERSVEIAHSSRRLLEMVDEVLEEAGCALEQVTGLVTLRGPGSFTGLRVGLATTLGLHQALGVPAAAPSTLEILAAAGADATEPGGRTVAVVDVLRGEWAAQPFTAGRPPVALAEPERLPAAELARFRPAVYVGFGVEALEELTRAPEQPPDLPHDEPDRGSRLLEPPALAPVAARLAVDHPPTWDAGLLVRPLYFRPPAVTLPKRRQRRKAPVRSRP